MFTPVNSRYTIDLPVFSGPLDLLLHLIDQNELDITTLSLISITDQYLAQIEKLKSGKIDQLMDFIVIGARLLLIKSRALLPKSDMPSVSDEEEEPAETLARQLREYKRFKDLALWLDNRRESGFRSYLRVAPPIQLDSRIELSEVGLESLVNAFRAALDRTQLFEESIGIVTDRREFTIDNQIQKLRSLLSKKGKTSFQEMLSSSVSYQELAVSLLAILELIKRNEVVVIQMRLFGPIEIIPSQSSSGEQATATSR